ncbi:MAG: hypothetical protein [Caudoviricetes sp.]|nr:MAG: hypothetical protein [Caudoviricetes sp.]
MNREVPINISTGMFVDYCKDTKNATDEDLIRTLVLTMAKLRMEGFDMQDLVSKSIKNEEKLLSFIRGNFAKDLRKMNDEGVFNDKESKELYEEVMDSSDEVLIGFVLESLFDIKGDNQNENN